MKSRFIEQQDLKNLHVYAFKGQDDSLATRYFMDRYWSWLVTFVPLWVAPNAITLFGFGFILANFATLTWYDVSFDCQNSVPRWAYATFSVGLFIYQSLDCIDGKQARRTGLSSPLGELFDHLCDALYVTMGPLLCASALNSGRSWLTVATVVGTYANFFLPIWREYHLGTLHLSSFGGGVEGVLIVCAVHLVSSLNTQGPLVWEKDLLKPLTDALGWRLASTGATGKMLFLALIFCGLTASVIGTYTQTMHLVQKGDDANPEAPEKGKARVDAARLSLVPIVLHSLLNILWMASDNSYILRNDKLFLPFMCFWGVGYAYHVGLVIIKHVSKGHLPRFNVVLLWTLAGAVDAFLPNPIIQSSPERMQMFVYASLAGVIGLYIFMCADVIETIKEELGLSCFVVTKPSKAQVINLDSVDQLKAPRSKLEQ